MNHFCFISHFICIITICTLIAGAATDYVFTFLEPQNDEITNSLPYLLVTTSSINPTSVSVSVPGISFHNVSTVSREKLANISLPIEIYLTGTAKQDKAVFVHSEARVFVHAVYIYKNYRSTGFSVFPTTLLGQSYVVSSNDPDDYEFSEYSITALDEATAVEVLHPSSVSFTTFRISLEAYQTYQKKSPIDLSGTFIRADKPVSVMSGGSAIHVGSTLGGPEYMIQHVPPIERLGTTYILAPFKDRTSGYETRVIATEPGTEISTAEGSAALRLQRTLDSYRYYDITQSTSVLRITASKPVLVAQFAKSYNADTHGDTFMLIVPPIQTAAKEDISFPVTTLAATADVRSYLSITIDCEHISAITVDGAAIFDTSVWDKQEVAIGQTSYCVLQREYNHGVHHIMTPGQNVPYEAIVYGFSQKYVAYAFNLWGLAVQPKSPRGEFEGKL